MWDTVHDATKSQLDGSCDLTRYNLLVPTLQSQPQAHRDLTQAAGGNEFHFFSDSS